MQGGRAGATGGGSALFEFPARAPTRAPVPVVSWARQRAVDQDRREGRHTLSRPGRPSRSRHAARGGSAAPAVGEVHRAGAASSPGSMPWEESGVHRLCRERISSRVREHPETNAAPIGGPRELLAGRESHACGARDETPGRGGLNLEEAERRRRWRDHEPWRAADPRLCAWSSRMERRLLCDLRQCHRFWVRSRSRKAAVQHGAVAMTPRRHGGCHASASVAGRRTELQARATHGRWCPATWPQRGSRPRQLTGRRTDGTGSPCQCAVALRPPAW